jgi:hypothetical protein
MSMTLAQQARLIEARYAANHYSGCESCHALLAIDGSIPLLLTAPHAVSHPRRGGIKAADTFTGALVIQLCERTGAFGLVQQRMTGEDPNFDAHGSFKDALRGIVAGHRIACVLDLHGMARSRPWEVAIGTAAGVTLGGRTEMLHAVTGALRSEGMTNVLIDDDVAFAARDPNTIAHFVWRTTRSPAMQIEIHKDFRDPGERPDDYHRLLRALESAIASITLASTCERASRSFDQPS